MSESEDQVLTWVAIEEAVRDHRDTDLADIAICLYGQLGEARAEISRLRASLWASMRALAPDMRPGGEPT
jgi:hypothetical protein